MDLWQWFYDLSFSGAMRGAFWAFPMMECIHIYSMICLIAFAGAFDIRLMGFRIAGTAHRPISEFAKTVLRWAWIPLVVNVATGVLMFGSNALQYSTNSAFVIKMLLVFFGVTYHIPILLAATRWEEGSAIRLRMKLASVSALLVWVAVIVASRWIAYSYA